MGRLEGLSHSETFAAEAVARAIGAEIEPFDVAGRQGVVDVMLHYPDGRIAALEVTTHAGPGVRQTSALLHQDDYTWDNPGQWWWTLTVGNVEDLPRLREVYGRVILICERMQVVRPEDLPWGSTRSDPDVSWLLGESSSQLTGHPDVPSVEGDRVRGVMVVPEGRGGAVDEYLSTLPAELEQMLRLDSIARRCAKLLRTNADERHLFLGLGPGSVSDSLYLALMDPHGLPEVGPKAPAGLTHVWLTTGYGQSLIGWDTTRGWSEHYVFD